MDLQKPNLCECLNEAERTLHLVENNLRQLLQEFSTPPLFLDLLSSDVERLEHEVKSLSGHVEFLLSYLNSEMTENRSELEETHSQLHTLQQENEKTRSQLASLNDECSRLRSQLQHQSAFCGSLGAVLGNLLWKASRVPPVIDLLLAGNRVADFLCIVSGTLDSFLQTFDTVMPGPTADESQFIMAMSGTVTNLAAAPAGRQFLVCDPNGRDLILQIIRIMPMIPTPSGNCLRRILLMALYNISINQAGLTLLLEDGKGTIFSVILNCLQVESTNELRIMAMRLLLSLTCDMTDSNLLLKVPRDAVMELTRSKDTQLQAMAQEVIENITKACGSLDRSTFNTAKRSYADDEKPNKFPTTAWRLPRSDLPSHTSN